VTRARRRRRRRRRRKRRYTGITNLCEERHVQGAG